MSEPVVAVAVSGGRDSTALLHATCRAARGTGLRVVALHVHHGLLPEADGWVRHLHAQCARWRRAGAPLTLRWQRLEGGPGAGDSIEAWARHGRYAALSAMARAVGATRVLLAHHAQDQAETVLLQALRSPSPRGLAAMPAEIVRDGVHWIRPWLEMDPARIEGYARRYRLRWVTDPSNADPRLARSRMRTQVWPALVQAFPAAPAALAALARRAHESAACLAALATLDLQACSGPEGELDRAAWLQLDVPRRANAVRHWLRAGPGRIGFADGDRPVDPAVGSESPLPIGDAGRAGRPGIDEVDGSRAAASLVDRLLVELPQARGGSRWPAGPDELVLHRGRLRWAPAAVKPGDGPRPAPGLLPRIDLSRVGWHALAPWRGRLHVRPVPCDGVPAALLRDVELRPRAGAERFQQHPGGIPRSLKKAYQSAGVPALERGGPLLHAGGQLVFVPGLGLDARLRQAAGEDLRVLEWVPDPA